MSRFIIRGGKPLFGTVTPGGSKNAALPVLFACIAARGRSTIYNLPKITDVKVALDILRSLGATVEQNNELTVIDTSSLSYCLPDGQLVCKIRASTYLLGAMLARFGRAELMSFGGCNFASRPIDIHLAAAKAFGASCNGESLKVKRLLPADFRLSKPSVGATVNSLIISCAAQGESRIYGFAKEPHINTLIAFLNSAGARITVGKDVITVKGGALHGGSVEIPPDMIEAGTYLAASMVTHGCVKVRCDAGGEPKAFLLPILECGGAVCEGSGTVYIKEPPKKFINILTAPYPGFPTDLQPIIAPVMALICGGKITETVWQGRFGYLSELEKFGISSRVIDNTAEIFESEPVSAISTAKDLRAGAACILAALAADGVSEVNGAELVLRGYESPIKKLSALGAELEYIEN